MLSDGEPVYVGSTRKDADARVRLHRREKKAVASWNPALAEFLAKGKPEYQELAVVPDSERLQLEAQMIRTLGARHKLLNKFHNGYCHSPETRAKISEGVRRHYRTSRSGTAPHQGLSGITTG